MKGQIKNQNHAINSDRVEELLEIQNLLTPRDPFLLNYSMFLLLGIVLILPFHSLIQSLTFLEINLPERNIEFVISTLTNVPIFLGHILMLFLSKFFNIKLTLAVGLVITALICLSIPFLTDNITNVEILWLVILVVIPIFWFVNGCVQSCGYGFSGVFPQRIVASFNNGTGSSGIVAAFIQAALILAFPTKGTVVDDPQLFISSVLFFGISSGLWILSAVLLVISFGTDYSWYYSNGKSSKESTEKVDSVNSLMRSSLNLKKPIENQQSSVRSSNFSDEDKPSILKIHNENWINLWGLTVNFLSVMLTFPGLLLQRPIRFIDYVRWVFWFTIFVFSFFNLVGRIFGGYYTIKNKYLWAILTGVRLITIVIAFLSAYDVSFFGSTTVVVLNIIASSFSFGYLMTCQIIMVCTLPEPYELETAGKLVLVFIQGGVVIGSLIATFGISLLF